MPKVLLMYHFFHPDEVISARLFSDLARALQSAGCAVTVLTSNRSRRDLTVEYPSREVWEGVDVQRIRRPAWPQSNALGRIANTAFIQGAWLLRVLRDTETDVVVVGSDPPLTALLATILRPRLRRTTLIHWCFDLYPEAVVAHRKSFLIRALATAVRPLIGRAYRAFDHVVDIGPQMRQRIASYRTPARFHTITPWALVEPTRPSRSRPERAPGGSVLTLLYSGNLGAAHDAAPLITLARALRADGTVGARFCFAVDGARAAELRRYVTADDVNIELSSLRAEASLQTALEAADLHMVSLRPSWNGVVVPSKFFAALAVGRPVVYSGAPDSDVARWIEQYRVGFVLTGDNADEIAERVRCLGANPDALWALQQRAHEVYQTVFSRAKSLAHWAALVSQCVSPPASVAELRR